MREEALAIQLQNGEVIEVRVGCALGLGSGR